MTESLVTEWLADCEDLKPSDLRSFADNLSKDDGIVRALYALLEERSRYSELVDTVCHQLFSFYRSEEIELQQFTIQFLPTLIYIYLNSIAHSDVKSYRAMETLLIGVYNLEVVDKNGQPKTVSFRLPSLAVVSIYHEPSSLAPASLTENEIRRFEECNSKPVTWGPLKQVENLNAQNRLKVMTALLFIYNQRLSFISKSSLEQLCKVTTKLVTQGFVKSGHSQRSSYNNDSSFVPRLLPRIPISSQLLLEFLHSVYYAMYNECWSIGLQAVEDVHNRGCYEMFPDVMLVTNAIRNLTISGPPGQPGDSLGIALSSINPTPTVSKSMITNASFRTKKLPDDIPIQITKEEQITDGKGNLVSITEEEASEPTRTGSVRQGKDSRKLTAFAGLGKKLKDKDKEKEKDKSSKNGYVSQNDKEKKTGSQSITKDSKLVRGETIDLDGNTNGNIIRKKNTIVESNAITGDPVTSLVESGEVLQNLNLDASQNHKESKSHGTSMQVSSV